MSTNPTQSKITATPIAVDSTLNINPAEITAIATLIYTHGTIRDWKAWLITAEKIGFIVTDENPVTEITNAPLVDSDTIRSLIRKELNNWDFSSYISDEIDNHDFSDEISRAILDSDFSDEIKSAVRGYDFSDEISEAISDKDFSDEISEAVSNHDFSDVISEQVSEAIDSHDFSDVLESESAKETILEIVKNWFKGLVG